MNIARIAQERHSCKAFDPQRKIPLDTLAQLRMLLRCAPSSINAQPWHFVIASSEKAKARIGKATEKPYDFNAAKVRDASHVLVCAVRDELTDAYLNALLAQEERDGRFPTPQARDGQHASRSYFAGLHRNEYKDAAAWMSRQVYIALGMFLLGAAALGVDACPIEGFDAQVLDQELGLSAQGLHSLVLVCVGYRSAEDYNATLPKSRWPESAMISDL